MEKPVAQGQSQMSRILNNVLIGLFIPFISQPFEVIRTSSIISLETQADGTKVRKFRKNVNLSGMLKTVSDIWKQEGFNGFYRGGSFALMKGAAGYVSFFTGLEEIRKRSKKMFNSNSQNSHLKNSFINFFNASTARILTTLLLNPINIMKTRFEVLGSENSSVTGAVRQFYQANGARGFFTGLLPSLAKDVPYSGLQYSFYRSFLDGLGYKKGSNSVYEKVKVSTAAFFSSVAAILITYPMDNIRIRFQTDDFNAGKDKLRSSKMEILREAYRKEGLQGFYQGYLPRIVKKGVNSMLCWILYESLQQNDYSH